MANNFVKLTSCLKIERKPFTNFTLLGPLDGDPLTRRRFSDVDKALTKEGLDSHSQSNRPPMAKSSLFALRGAQTKYRDFIEINFYNEHVWFPFSNSGAVNVWGSREKVGTAPGLKRISFPR